MILSLIPPVDYLKVSLVSKSFHNLASTEFKWETMNMAEVIQGQTSLEASLPRTRKLIHFICTHCGLVKSANKFSDNQAVKTNRTRICISCGISRRKYTKGQMPKIKGVEHIPCWHCREAVPKYEGWQEAMVLGKIAVAGVLEGSRTRGIRQSYLTADGRTLDWPYEIQVLAFCKRCLELMMRHKEAAPGLRGRHAVMRKRRTGP